MLSSRAVPPIDDVTGNGSANGHRRRARARRGGSGEDDRPRGFEPDRMRRLWGDIDHARDNLGLGPAADVAAAPWNIAGTFGYAAALATDALGVVVGWASRLPDSRRVVADAVPCVRRVPIIGAFFE